MKIKIDSEGRLWIERGGKYKMQECKDAIQYFFKAHGSTGSNSFINRACGDWCPLFGEPSDEMLMICENRFLDCGNGSITDNRPNITN